MFEVVCDTPELALDPVAGSIEPVSDPATVFGGTGTGTGRARPQPHIRRARRSVTLMFGLHGLAMGSWAARIPWIQGHLQLSPGALGLALLGTAAGGFVALPGAGWLVGRFGSRPVTRTAMAVVAASLALPALAPDLPVLFVALLVFGGAGGVADVAFNAQGSHVQASYGRTLMPGLHGLWSAGGLVGATAGGLVARAGVGAPAHLAVAAAVVLAGGLLAAPGLLDLPRPPDGSPALAWPRRGLFALGAIGLCSLFAEAAAGDWSAVYLTERTGATAGVAATGYAAFSVAMAVVRLAGNRTVDRLGPVRTTRIAATVGAVGLAVGLLVPDPLVGALAFGALGLGVAVLVPLVFGAAGSLPGRDSAQSIAGVATLSYGGWLAAPGIIGLVAQVTSLTVALAAVAVLVALVVPLAGALRPR